MNIRGHAIASGTMLGTFTLTGSFVENGRTVQIKPRTVDLTKNGAIVTAIDYDYKGGGGYAFT